MDCSKCIANCKADCCRGPVPMPRDILDRFKPVRPITHLGELGDDIVAPISIDENGVVSCAFLGYDNRCSIYHDRPEVCRLFGTEVDILMTCSYQAHDGRIRSRQERRSIERQQQKAAGHSMRRVLGAALQNPTSGKEVTNK